MRLLRKRIGVPPALRRPVWVARTRARPRRVLVHRTLLYTSLFRNVASFVRSPSPKLDWRRRAVHALGGDPGPV